MLIRFSEFKDLALTFLNFIIFKTYLRSCKISNYSLHKNVKT